MPNLNKVKELIWHKEGAQVARYFLNVALPLHKMIEHIQYTMGCPKYAKAQQNEKIIQNSKVVNQIQIINGLEKGNITRALKGERVQRPSSATFHREATGLCWTSVYFYG